MCIRVSVSGAAQSNELAPTADETQLSHGVPKSPRRGATVETPMEWRAPAGREESLAGGGLLSEKTPSAALFGDRSLQM